MARKKKQASGVNADAPIFKNEPVLTVGVVGALVVTVASVFGVALDLNTVETVITDGILVFGAVIARAKVTPYQA